MAIGFIAPCQPVLVPHPPAGDGWSHEIKHDGYRIIAALERGAVRIFTRRGHDWTARMPAIATALARLKVRAAIIDGEAVTLDGRGVSDFFALHAALARGSAPAAQLVAFDLLHLDGADLRQAPLEERRTILAKLLRRALPSVQFSEEIGGDGAAAWQAARDMGLEGIVSKRRGSPYRSGRSDAWRKTKCTVTDSFAVIGAEPKRGAVRSLALARLVDGVLTPCGSAGSGIGESDGRELRAAIDAGRPVVASIEFRGFTPAGELRHPVVRGWQAG